MREIEASEAKNKFGTLLDWVEKGEEVVITRGGKSVARLIPSASGVDREKATQAVANIVARRVGVTLGGLKIRDLVNEGRRKPGHRQFNHTRLVLRGRAHRPR